MKPGGPGYSRETSRELGCLRWLQPGEPVAHNSGLLSTSNGLLWGIVAYYFQLLGCPGRSCKDLYYTIRLQLNQHGGSRRIRGREGIYPKIILTIPSLEKLVLWTLRAKTSPNTNSAVEGQSRKAHLFSRAMWDPWRLPSKMSRPRGSLSILILGKAYLGTSSI